jgi:hypothetical protein
MDTVTRTFPISLTSSYTPNSIIELCHFRDMTFDADERVAVYLESFFCNLNLKSFNLGVISEFDGSESEAEKMAKFSADEAKSQKMGLRILTRKNNIGDWLEKAEIILVNRGRKDYFDLLQPYLAKNQVRIFEKNDALALQLIDYNHGLLKPLDSLGIEAAFTITISKKNDVEELENRLATLELAINGRLTNINPNHFLGREINQGVVTQIPFTRFATQANIDQAIIDLVGGSPGALNTLMELATALNNDANFGANIINALALKAPLANPVFTGVSKVQGATPGFWIDETDNAAKGAFLVVENGVLYIQRRASNFGAFETNIAQINLLNGDVGFSGFTTLGDAAVKCKILSGTTAVSQGGSSYVTHGLTGSKIVAYQGLIFFAPNNSVPIAGNQPAYASIVSHDATQFGITNVANNSAGILNLPFKLLVWYIA